MDNPIIFSGNSNPVLAKRICDYLGMPLGGAKVKTFSDGEVQIEIDENVRTKTVYVVQSTCRPVNDNLVELLLMIDALKRSSARKVTAVMPYFGYARQDKKVAPRVPISAKVVANLLATAGADKTAKIWDVITGEEIRARLDAALRPLIEDVLGPSLAQPPETPRSSRGPNG